MVAHQIEEGVAANLPRDIRVCDHAHYQIRAGHLQLQRRAVLHAARPYWSAFCEEASLCEFVLTPATEELG